MAKHERIKHPVKKEIEQKSNRLVQVSALFFMLLFGGVNVYAQSIKVDPPFDKVVFFALLAIAAGRDVAKPVLERIFGGKS